jgi:hypothetical protein
LTTRQTGRLTVGGNINLTWIFYESLEGAVRRVGVSCEAVAGQLDVNMETEGTAEWEAVTRRQPVKIQQTEKK